MSKAGCSLRLSLREGQQCGNPQAFSTPGSVAHLGDECLSLLEPPAHGRQIAQRKPEPGGRVDERATDPELVACLPKERQGLLEERLSPGVLPMRTDVLCQWEEGLGNFPWLASTHGEYARGQALFEEALALFRQAGNELWVGRAPGPPRRAPVPGRTPHAY